MRQRRLIAFLFAATLAWLPVSVSAQEAASLVGVETVREEPLVQTAPVIGRLVALQAGNIAARIGGPVRKVYVDVGDRVQKKQLLVELDEERLVADLTQAEAELAQAMADHGTFKAEVDLARMDMSRQEGLRTSTAFSQAKFDDAQKRFAVAESKAVSAEAKIQIMKAAVQRKRIDVEYTKVRAPYAGVIVQRSTEAGAYVNAGEAMMRMIGDEALEVEAEVPSNRLAGLPTGRIIDVRLDDGTSHKAKVRAILPSENPLTRTRTVRLEPEFGGVKRPLAESQSVTVFIPIGEERRVLTVHKDAVLKRPDGDRVFVVKEGTAEERKVELGNEVGSRMEVLTGLASGDEVVIRGNERLRPGAAVRIQKGAT
ncbi:MAG: efflux RND transporter periplasmic adaptor subunit [Pseudomonadota bacterium]|nr:efflux RND transporter periplasmic adaptor subunit [Pseudomonadota bacterium]